jgi:hypothetical protein
VEIIAHHVGSWTQWIEGTNCSTYKSKSPTIIKWICHERFLFMNVGIRVMFDQCPRDLTNCSHQLIQVIISSTCHFEHIEPHKLVVIHEFNLDIYIMFFHWCYYVDHCVKLKVLFDQNLRDPKHYSLEPREFTISFGYYFEPNDPKELVVWHTQFMIINPIKSSFHLFIYLNIIHIVN